MAGTSRWVSTVNPVSSSCSTVSCVSTSFWKTPPVSAIRLTALLLPRTPGKRWLAGSLLLIYPMIAFGLFHGSLFGLTVVETEKWGGLMLTLILALVGIGVAIDHGLWGNLQVQGFIQAFATVLKHDVLACHPQIGGPILDISGYVGSTDDDQLDLGMVGVQDQFAAGLGILGRHDIGRRQQRQGFPENATFG